MRKARRSGGPLTTQESDGHPRRTKPDQPPCEEALPAFASLPGLVMPVAVRSATVPHDLMTGFWNSFFGMCTSHRWLA